VKKSVVAVLRTSPETVLADYGRVMRLAGYREALPRGARTALKINTSWQRFFPACSTTPWQLDGVVRTMLEDGYPRESLYACQNGTVVVDARKGERRNKHLAVIRRHDIENVHLEEDGGWMDVREAVGAAADDFLVLNRIYPEGFKIPRRFQGENIIHLPTVKTHVFTTMTGAMKNAFGGLLNRRRHWTHEVIHETLVDLLVIQRKVHRGVFAVMDGTFAGDGPGPRCMRPVVKNVILASADPVAIDAAAARLMGYDPIRDIRFIRLADEMGLGVGDPARIEIVGDRDAAEENWNFEGPYRGMTFAARMQHAIYWGGLKRALGWSLKSPLAVWAYLASILYHDFYWYPLVGRRRVRRALRTPWGRLFRQY